MTTLKTNNLTKIIAAFLVFLLTFTIPCYANTSDDSIIDDTINVISNGYGYGALAVGALWVAGTAFSKSLLNNKSSNQSPANTSVTLNNITFDQPETPQILTITNTSKQLITIDKISLQNTNGITIDKYSCQSLIPNESCHIPLTASDKAYGNGNVVVKYFGYYNSKQAIANVTVKNTAIKLTNAQLIPVTTIMLPEGVSTQTFTYTNSGKFAWQGALIGWAGTSPAGVDITEDHCSAAIIAPAETCTFKLVTNDASIAGGSGSLSTTGANIYQMNTNVIIHGIAIVKHLISHLEYRAIEVINATTVALTPTISIDSSNANNLINTSKVKICSITDNLTDCPYPTTCKVDGTPTSLQQNGGNCLIWLKAISTATDDINTATGNIKVTATLPDDQGTPLSVKNFTIAYEQALYVGGDFYFAGSYDACRIAKWNGSKWDPLWGGPANYGMCHINSTVNAITAVNGDLYIGGTFSSAGGHSVQNIAKWNGDTWSGLVDTNTNIDGVNGGSVKTLNSFNGDIYVGGSFTSAGGFARKYIAKWSCTQNGSCTWSNVGEDLSGNSINVITNFNNNLYAGGDFTATNNTNAKNIAKLDCSQGSCSWSNLGNGISDPVNALTNLNNDLYMGGEFQYPTNSILKWSCAQGNCAMYDTGILNGNPLFGLDIFSLTNFNNVIYMGSYGISINSNVEAAAMQLNCTGTNCSWSNIGSGYGAQGSVKALVHSGSSLYAGGGFWSVILDTVGTKLRTFYLAKWSCSTSGAWEWSALTDDKGTTGLSDPVRALTIAPSLTII